jgi:hypothetical protein
VTPISVLGVNGQGELVDNTNAYVSNTVTENTFELSTVFNLIYPVGSLYVAMNNANPPGTDMLVVENLKWVKIDDDCTLWSSALNDLASELPRTPEDATSSSYYVTEQLPMPPPLTCSNTGSHTHQASFPRASLSYSNGAPAHSGPLSARETGAAGDHMHAIGYNTDGSSVYEVDASVRPRGLKCAIYVRVS